MAAGLPDGRPTLDTGHRLLPRSHLCLRPRTAPAWCRRWPAGTSAELLRGAHCGLSVQTRCLLRVPHACRPHTLRPHRGLLRPGRRIIYPRQGRQGQGPQAARRHGPCRGGRERLLCRRRARSKSGRHAPALLLRQAAGRTRRGLPTPRRLPGLIKNCSQARDKGDRSRPCLVQKPLNTHPQWTGSASLRHHRRRDACRRQESECPHH